MESGKLGNTALQICGLMSCGVMDHTTFSGNLMHESWVLVDDCTAAHNVSSQNSFEELLTTVKNNFRK